MNDNKVSYCKDFLLKVKISISVNTWNDRPDLGPCFEIFHVSAKEKLFSTVCKALFQHYCNKKCNTFSNIIRKKNKNRISLMHVRRMHVYLCLPHQKKTNQDVNWKIRHKRYFILCKDPLSMQSNNISVLGFAVNWK